MKKYSRIQGQALVAALLMSLFLIITSQAQTDLAVFTGKFTLNNQVLWGGTVLPPGDYTITISSTSLPTLTLITDSQGRPVARVMSAIDAGKPRAGNALLIREKDGQLRVYSLALGSLGRVLVYDRALARQAVLEARAPQTVPVMLTRQ